MKLIIILSFLIQKSNSVILNLTGYSKLHCNDKKAFEWPARDLVMWIKAFYILKVRKQMCIVTSSNTFLVHCLNHINLNSTTIRESVEANTPKMLLNETVVKRRLPFHILNGILSSPLEIFFCLRKKFFATAHGFRKMCCFCSNFVVLNFKKSRRESTKAEMFKFQWGRFTRILLLSQEIFSY